MKVRKRERTLSKNKISTDSLEMFKHLIIVNLVSICKIFVKISLRSKFIPHLQPPPAVQFVGEMMRNIPSVVRREPVGEEVPVPVPLPVLNHEAGDGAAAVLPASQLQLQARVYQTYGCFLITGIIQYYSLRAQIFFTKQGNCYLL